MQLSRLVLPAPLGPMMAWMSPWATLKLTPSSARTPPNRRVMSVISSWSSPAERAAVQVVPVGPGHTDLPPRESRPAAYSSFGAVLGTGRSVNKRLAGPPGAIRGLRPPARGDDKQ